MARAASIICCACATVTASGFSQRMCLPACAALTVHSQCMLLGKGLMIASISGSSNTAWYEPYALAMPYWVCACFGLGLIPARYGRDLSIAYGLRSRQMAVEGDLGGTQYSIAHDVRHGVSCAIQGMTSCARNAAISSSAYPASRSTASVCSPAKGAGAGDWGWRPR